MRLSRTIAHIAHALQACTLLLTDHRFAGRRRLLLTTYLRLRGRRLLRRVPAGDAVERVAGYQVRFFDYFSLDYLFNEIFLGLEYHFETESAAPFIVDCGSNIGMSVLYFKALHPDARILAFEPDSRANARLAENVHRNGLRDVELRRQAVGGRDGTIEFHMDPDDPGSLMMSTLESRMSKATQSVEMIRLSSCIDCPVDFLKLDVEGAELDVLRDLQREGRLRLIGQMVIEYHHHLDEDHDQLSRLLEILEMEGFGYQVSCPETMSRARGTFQDILLYAYRKQERVVRHTALAGESTEAALIS